MPSSRMQKVSPMVPRSLEDDSFEAVYKDLEQTLDSDAIWTKRQAKAELFKSPAASCATTSPVPLPKDFRSPDIFYCTKTALASHAKKPCTVLSFGIAYEFDIDRHFWKQGCFVDSYDPSMTKNGPDTKQYVLGPRHRFFLVGAGIVDGKHPQSERNTLYGNDGPENYAVKTLTTAIQDINHQAYANSQSDTAMEPATIVRMDIEGAEWDLLESWKKAKTFGNIKQLLLEIHFRKDSIGELKAYRRLQHILESISCLKTSRDRKTGQVPADEPDNCLVLKRATRNFWAETPLPGYNGNCKKLTLPLAPECTKVANGAWELVYVNPNFDVEE